MIDNNDNEPEPNLLETCFITAWVGVCLTGYLSLLVTMPTLTIASTLSVFALWVFITSLSGDF
jgi:hypothetical protein